MKAHEFALESTKGTIALSEFRGKWVVLYFYPKDDTPGCTIEANDFTKLGKAFTQAGAIILGVSPDSCESHQNFIDKYGLGVTLLSDPDSAVQKAYGAWGKKQMMGKEYMGTLRSTFLISPEGEIVQEWRMVKPEGHAKEVLEVVRKARHTQES